MSLRIQIINRSDLPDALALRVAADMCARFEAGQLDPRMYPAVQIPDGPVNAPPRGNYWIRAMSRDRAGLVFCVSWQAATRGLPTLCGSDIVPSNDR